MKIYYDKDIDAAYIQLSKKKPDGVTEISDFVNLDSTKDGEIVGIELLDASRKISIDSLFNYEIDVSLTKNKPLRHIRSKNKAIV